MMIELLDDPNPNVRDDVAYRLGWLGPKAKGAAPTLVRLIETGSGGSRALGGALKAIDPETAEQVLKE
jgi:hypothetical protein